MIGLIAIADATRPTLAREIFHRPAENPAGGSRLLGRLYRRVIVIWPLTNDPVHEFEPL